MPRGLLIDMEGGDGSGKTVQTELLVTRMNREISATESVSFPDYTTPTGQIIKAVLTGHFGDPLAFAPRVASLFYAADRLAQAADLEAKLASGIHMIANRYEAANKGHQGSKFTDVGKMHEFFDWEDRLEFGLNGIPKPELNIILSVPVDVSLRLLKERAEATGKPMDGHEVRDHLEAAKLAYAELARVSPDVVLIECGTPDGLGILPKEVIHEKVWAVVQPLLAA